MASPGLQAFSVGLDSRYTSIFSIIKRVFSNGLFQNSRKQLKFFNQRNTMIHVVLQKLTRKGTQNAFIRGESDDKDNKGWHLCPSSGGKQ